MVVDRESLKRKLKKLEEVVGKLEDCRKATRDEFFVDFKLSDAAIHNLVLGIEIVVDIGQHLLSEFFQTGGDSYKEIIEKLGEKGVVPRPFAQKNKKMASFRNLLIHEYLQVDLNKVYENLRKAPGIFRRFARYYLEFLENHVERK